MSELNSRKEYKKVVYGFGALAVIALITLLMYLFVFPYTKQHFNWFPHPTDMSFVLVVILAIACKVIFKKIDEK